MSGKYKEYPEHTVKRVGIKVMWYNFATKELANKASKVALHNAGIQASKGFDFGYCYPSDITKEEDGTYTVCVP